MAPAIVLNDPAAAQELTEILHMEKDVPATVWLPPDIFASGLQPRQGQTCPQIFTTVAPVSGGGVRPPIRHLADAIPATIESRAQLKRWGLKIRFQ